MSRPFNWQVDCPGDVGRSFPPIVGVGRGERLEEADKRRKMQGRPLTGGGEGP